MQEGFILAYGFSLLGKSIASEPVVKQYIMVEGNGRATLLTSGSQEE